MKKLSLMLAILVFGGGMVSAASSQGGRSNPVPLLRFVSNEALIDASMQVDECTRDVRPSPRPVQLCNRDWRGIRWVLSSNWTGYLDTPTGVRWIISCRYDSIEREDRCVYAIRSGLAIVRSDGYATLVNWGLERYPGSQLTVRFDNGPPISTSAEAWTDQQSRTIYRRMITGNFMRYLWYDWPQNIMSDERLDLTGFANAAALMEAVRQQFTVSRVLGRIEVPR